MISRKQKRGKDPFLRTIRFVAGRWRLQWRLALAMAALGSNSSNSSANSGVM